MAERSGFFNAQETSTGVYDRTYNAEDFSRIFDLMTPDGVMITYDEAQQETIDKTTVSGLKVLKGSDDSKLIISPGFAMIKGHWYHNDEEKEKSVEGILGGESTYNINIFILYSESNRSVICDALGDSAYNSLEEENKILLATYNYMTKELEDKREKFVIPWINSFYTLFNNAINTLTNRVNNMFPIGSIYITASNANPGSFIGGTWKKYGEGKTLVCQSDSDSDFKTAGKTGGSKTVTLNINQIPSHNHRFTVPDYTYYVGEGNTGEGAHDMNEPSVNYANNTTNTGGGQPHNNMPPYVVVYFWERVA